jgi:hypothetical protein
MDVKDLPLEERFELAVVDFAKRNSLRHRTRDFQFTDKYPIMRVADIWEYDGPYVPAALEKGASKVIVGYWDSHDTAWIGDFRTFLKEDYDIDTIDGDGRTEVQLFGVRKDDDDLSCSDFVQKTNSA